MNTLSYKTVSVNKANANKEWLLVDAENQTLGRLASEIAKLLRGKHKTNFTPHSDCGDFVVVINSEKIQLGGNKWADKVYLRHTGYPGGQRSLTAEVLHKKNNIRLVENAVRGMLPKNKLGTKLYKNMHVFPDSIHTLEAQKPRLVTFNK